LVLGSTLYQLRLIRWLYANELIRAERVKSEAVPLFSLANLSDSVLTITFIPAAFPLLLTLSIDIDDSINVYANGCNPTVAHKVVDTSNAQFWPRPDDAYATPTKRARVVDQEKSATREKQADGAPPEYSSR
jgi:hypothetical protein